MRTPWRSQSGVIEPSLCVPTERVQLDFEELEAVGERLAVTLITALVEIAQNAGAVQQQAIELTRGVSPLQRVSSLVSSLGLESPTNHFSRLHLRFNGLTFPASCHSNTVYAVWVARATLLIQSDGRAPEAPGLGAQPRGS